MLYTFAFYLNTIKLLSVQFVKVDVISTCKKE